MPDLQGQWHRDVYALVLLLAAGVGFLALLGSAPFARLRVALFQTQKARLVDFLMALSGHIRSGAKPEEALARFTTADTPGWIVGIAQEWAAGISGGRTFADAAPSVLVTKTADRALLAQAVNVEQLAAGVQNLAAGIRVRSGAIIICTMLALELFGGIILNLLIIDQSHFVQRIQGLTASGCFEYLTFTERLTSISNSAFPWTPFLVILTLVAVTAFLLLRIIREPSGDYERASPSQSITIFAASDGLRKLRFFKLGVFIFGAFFCCYLLSLSISIIAGLFEKH